MLAKAIPSTKLRLFFNLRTKLFILIAPLFLVPAITVSIIINELFSSYMIEKETMQLNYINEKINDGLDEWIAYVDNHSQLMISNDYIQQSLAGESSSYLQYKIRTFLFSMRTNRFDSIIYMDNAGTIYNTDNMEWLSVQDIESSRMYDKLKNTSGAVVWDYNPMDFMGKPEPYIYAARKINQLSFQNPPGILIFKIRPDKFGSIIKGQNEQGHVLLSDESGRLIYSAGSNETISTQIVNRSGSEIIADDGSDSGLIEEVNGEKMLLQYFRNASIGWSVVSAIDYDVAIREVRQIQQLMIWMMVISTLVALIMAVLISYSFTKPFKLLVKSMRQIKKGKFDIRIQLRRTDELGELADNFNKMCVEIERLVHDVKEEQNRANRAELNMLIHQINPHFLYNTLDNINMLSMMSGEPRIAHLITSLSRLLRITLSKGSEVIDVGDEMEHVRNYLAIERERFGAQLFDYTIETDPDLLNCKIVKIILQPLAENCIRHGFKETLEGGRIDIRGFCQGRTAVFEVKDNGIGVNPKQLAELNRLYLQGEGDPHDQSGYGLRNVNSRLRIRYGENYRLEFESEQGCGLTCRIVIDRFIEEV